MENLFRETVNNWEDWGNVYQSIPAFSRLAEEIFRREGLDFAPLESLTPGTNAVFKSGKYVVKIFFPKESGLDPLVDFTNEAAVCGYLTENNIPTPKFIAKGMISDKYDFYYIITEFREGVEAGEYLESATDSEKTEFAKKLKEILCKLNRPANGLIKEIDTVRQAVNNFRLDKLPEALRDELITRAKAMDMSEKVLVHGDLTGENILVSGGEPVIIDCADAHIAPSFYELGPIVFELFRCDTVLLNAFCTEDREEFIKKVLDCVCIHDFGADFIYNEGKRRGREFTSLSEFEEYLKDKFSLKQR